MTEKLGVVESGSVADVIGEVGSVELTTEAFQRIARVAYSSRKRRDELKDIVGDWRSVESTVSKASAPILQGYCHFAAGDLDGAEKIFSREKSSPWGAYFLARVLLARQRFRPAFDAVDAAHKKFADFAPLAFLAIEVSCKVGEEAQVPGILESLEAQFGETSELAYHRGLYHERLSEYGEAIGLYRKATSLDPANTRAWFRLGFLVDLAGRGDEAALDESISAYEHCLKAVPPHTNAVINLAILYEDRERYHDAVKCYETVLRHYPNHERARLFLEDARAATRMFYDRDEEKKADRQSQVLKIPVTDFELSVRSRNCLQKMNILTLGDLIMKTEQELLSYKNFGETSLKEIRDMLQSKALRLGQGLEQKGAEVNQPRNPLEATADPAVLDKAIDDVELSVRSRRCMERLGVKTVRDLINMTEVQLMSAKNFGMTSLNEIKRKLAEFGLKLRG